MDEAGLRSGDAFLLGYLPHLVRAQFDALALLVAAREGAEGELAKQLETMLAILPQRGPEVVSCVWQLESIVVQRLHAPPLPEPDTAEACAELVRGAAAAFATAPAANSDGARVAYELGARAGAAEALLKIAPRLWLLWSLAPSHVQLSAVAAEVRRGLMDLATAPRAAIDCPTLSFEDEALRWAIGQAATVAARPPVETAVLELAQAHGRVALSASALEAAAWGTPRASVRAWHEKRMTGTELVRRLAEHHRWNVPVHAGPDGKPAPHVYTFDKRVLFGFSDRAALAARPDLIKSDKPDEQQCLTVAGALLFGRLPADVDVLVLDATNDPNAPLTINYPKPMHAMLRQVANEVSFELAACDWTEIDPKIMRAYRYWILVGGNNVKTLLAKDALGRPLAALFSTEAALEAHLALAAPEQKSEFAACQRYLLPGEQLFPSLAKLGIGMILNPSGPGRTRAFNRRTVERLAAPPQ